MLSTAIVIFRETIEIAMILGVVLAATRGLAGRTIWIAGGFAAGLLGASLVAAFAGAISNAASGMGQEFFNAGILFTAALVIGWTVVWMKTHAREMVTHMREVGHNVSAGKTPHYSLSVIIGLAILREGSEIVLFIYGMILSGQSHSSIFAGSAVGLVLGTTAGWMLYMGLIRMQVKRMLTVTSWLLILLVAGLSSQGAGYLTAAGYFSSFPATPVWNSAWLLSEEGVVGKALHSLIGYSERPSQIQLLFYVGTLALLLGVIAVMERKKPVVAMAAIMALLFLAAPDPAKALDEIYSPIVGYRELSVEYNGSRTFDSDPTKNNASGHEFMLEWGATPRLMLETSVGFEKNPQDSLKLDHFEAESRFQFFEQGKYWVDSGLLVAYGHAVHAGNADTLEVKLLLQKDTGRWTHTTNIGFGQEIGVNASGGPDYAFLWNSRYRYNEYFEPGVEIQSDLGIGHTLQRFNEQEHYVGPAVYGRLFGHLKYQVAYLVGVSEESASSAGRVLLEYEMHL